MGALTQIFYFLTIVLVLSIFGYPIASICLPDNNRKHWIGFSMLCGAALLPLLLNWLNALGFSMSDVSIWLIVFFVAIDIIIIIKRSSKQELEHSFNKKNAVLIILSFCAAGFILLQTVAFNGFNPYSDGYTYISISDYIVNHSYYITVKPDIYHPWLSQVYLYQTNGYRIGAIFLMGYFAALFHVQYSMEVFVPCLSAVLFLLIQACLFLVRSLGVKSSLKTEIFTVILVGFNSALIQWPTAYGFYPQIYGLTYFVCVIGMFFKQNYWKDYRSKSIFIIGIFIAAILFGYIEVLPFAALSSLMILCVKFYNNPKDTLRIYLYSIIALMLGVLLPFPYTTRAMGAVVRQMQAAVGWNITYSLWDYLAQIFGVAPSQFNFSSHSTVVIISISIITITVYFLFIFGVINSLKVKKEISIYFVAILVPFFIISVYFIFIAKNPFVGGRGQTWSTFKLIQYYLPLILSFAAVFISSLTEKSYKTRLLVFICIVGLGVLNTFYNLKLSYSMVNEMRSYTGNSKNPIGEYYALAGEYRNTEKTINLVDLPQKQRQMVTYMLKGNRLASDWSSDGYFSSIWGLSNPQYDSNGIFLKFDTNNKKAVANLIKTDETVFMKYGKGFWGQEKVGNYNDFHWAVEDSELNVSNYSDSDFVKVSMNVCTPWALDNTDTITVTCDGKTLAKLPLSKEDNQLSLLLSYDHKNGEYVKNIKFHYGGKVVKLINDDRKLAFNVKGIYYVIYDKIGELPNNSSAKIAP